MRQSELLAEVMDRTRERSLDCIEKLKATDMHRVFSCGDVKLNSAIWITGHLSVTENWLLLRSTGGEHVKIPWARTFGMGGGMPGKDDVPPLEELLETLEEVHRRSLAHISSLTDAQLEEDNNTGFDLFGVRSKRDVIIHAIRHEGIHCGHLGWLCKLNGIKTI
jgi:hypothetical protein